MKTLCKKMIALMLVVTLVVPLLPAQLIRAEGYAPEYEIEPERIMLYEERNPFWDMIFEMESFSFTTKDGACLIEAIKNFQQTGDPSLPGVVNPEAFLLEFFDMEDGTFYVAMRFYIIYGPYEEIISKTVTFRSEWVIVDDLDEVGETQELDTFIRFDRESSSVGMGTVTHLTVEEYLEVVRDLTVGAFSPYEGSNANATYFYDYTAATVLNEVGMVQQGIAAFRVVHEITLGGTVGRSFGYALGTTAELYDFFAGKTKVLLRDLDIANATKLTDTLYTAGVFYYIRAFNIANHAITGLSWVDAGLDIHTLHINRQHYNINDLDFATYAIATLAATSFAIWVSPKFVTTMLVLGGAIGIWPAIIAGVAAVGTVMFISWGFNQMTAALRQNITNPNNDGSFLGRGWDIILHGLTNFSIQELLAHIRGDVFSLNATNTVSPIAINLTGQGIFTMPIAAGIHFDHYDTGFRIPTGWVAPCTGLLVRDVDGRGLINFTRSMQGLEITGRHLFGNNTMLSNGQLAANGFEALRDITVAEGLYDGVFDARSPAFHQLFLWIDENSNGIVDMGELIPLSASGIVSINLYYLESDYIDANGNHFRQVSTATLENGLTVDAIDVWFVRDTMNSIPSDTVPVDPSIASLPNIPGFGTVNSLHQTMAQCETGRLQSLLEQFVAEQNPTARRNLMTPIIHTWTGATGARANVLALEALTGERYTGNYGGSFPMATEIVRRGFQGLADVMYETLMAQSHFSHLYEKMVQTGGTSDSPIFDMTNIGHEIVEIMQNDSIAGERLFFDFIRNVHAIRMVSSLDLTGFRRVIVAENPRLGEFIDALALGFNPQTIVLGTEGNDTIAITGVSRHLVLGLGGDDVIDARNATGNNEIDPGPGNNTIFGGRGTDTYIIRRGYGRNTITANSHDPRVSRDRLVLRDGITQDEVFLLRVGNNLEVVVMDSFSQTRTEAELPFEPMTLVLEDDAAEVPTVSNAPNRVVFVDFFTGGNPRQITSITFDNGVVVPLSTVLQDARARIYGTDGDDVIVIPSNVGHQVFGLGGNDIIRATGGGNNTIDPGTGNNRIYGGAGTDTYVIGRNYGMNIILCVDDEN